MPLQRQPPVRVVNSAIHCSSFLIDEGSVVRSFQRTTAGDQQRIERKTASMTLECDEGIDFDFEDLLALHDEPTDGLGGSGNRRQVNGWCPAKALQQFRASQASKRLDD